jgi:PKD domain
MVIFNGSPEQTVKKIITSNWRPVRRSLCTLFLCIVALWSSPRSAHAQLYVNQQAPPTSQAQSGVSEYNTTTGAAINANFITGLNEPVAIAVSGNDLFVANIIGGTAGVVSEYNAVTGTPINASFVAGLADPSGLALSGNNLFVGSSSGTIGVYDATTGAAINASFITGLSQPIGLAVSDNTIFVANFGNQTIGKYNAMTGVAINASFITGLNSPIALAVSGNNLLVANSENGTVGEYDATTGAVINVNFITGLTGPEAIALLGNSLFVANDIGADIGGVGADLATVGEYNATTGAVINANLITGLNEPFGLAVAATLPIANAGPNQTVQAGTLVTLDGSASSDPTGQLPLTYAWSFVSQPNGSSATLSDPTVVHPTFTPNVAGSYAIQLVVTDAAGLSSAATTVSISTTDAPPVANAGPDQKITAIGTDVQLDGSGSYDLAGLPITYQWSFVSKPFGSKAALTGPTTATPSFVADVLGVYSIQLIVTDSLGTASRPAIVSVSFNDVAPVANAGPSQSAVVNEAVTLNGSKSTDSNGEPLTYNWSLVSTPKRSKAVISNPTAEIARFLPDLPGTYEVQLIVNDGSLNSLPATAEIEVVSAQTQLTMNIHSLQQVIANLPASAFKVPRLRNDLLKKLNAVIENICAREYRHAEEQLLDDLLRKVNGCATSGAPDRGDWIVNCEEQNMVYPRLLNIIAEVKAIPSGRPALRSEGRGHG